MVAEWSRRLGFGLALLGPATSLSGCQSDVLEQLSGRWVGSRMESLDGSISAARAGWAKGTSLSFSGRRVAVGLPGEPPRWGAFEVVSERDGELTLEIAGHDGHVDRAKLTLETEELLRWHVTDVHTLVLRRP